MIDMTNAFIEKASVIHKTKYDYSLVDYVNSYSKIKIICNIHGVFEQRPNDHLCGKGCSKCNGGITYNKNSFIDKGNKIHSNKYDYSLVEYVNSITSVNIICPIHGMFSQLPQNHLRGCKCPDCAYDENANNHRRTCGSFIDRSNVIHNNRYDYSIVDYKHGKKKVKIICAEHGIFEQTPSGHLYGRGCPKCRQSKGEKFIEGFFIKNNIKYIAQKSENDCKNILKLFFDFYLPDLNVYIEYDGIQHFEPIKHFGGEAMFEIQQNRDKIKNDYCMENNIALIRVKYDENIEDKLNSLLISK